MIDTEQIRRQVDLLALIGGELRKVAATGGGEYAGPCPFCGGRDRLRVQPNHDQGGRWFCRQCTGEQWYDAIDFVQRRDRVDFRQAAAMLGGAELPTVQGQAARPAATVDLGGDAPADDWQAAALDAIADCCMSMQRGIDWHEGYQHDGRYDLAQRGRLRELTPDAPTAARAYAWLRDRGLALGTIGGANIGYNDRWREVLPGHKLAPGIVIPNMSGGVVWYVNVRASKAAADLGKYLSLRGSALASLYAPGDLAAARYVVIVEGELDALLLHQAAGDLVGVATMGSAGSIPKRWALSLAHARLLVSLDNDAAGQSGAARWLALGGQPMPPGPAAGEDVTDFWRRVGLEGLRAWVQHAISSSEAA